MSRIENGHPTNLVNEGVAAASGLIMLLQDQNLLPGLGHDGRGGQAADPAADDDRIEALRNLIRTETLLQDGVALFLVRDVRLPGFAVIL